MEQNKIIEKLESIEKLLHEQNVMKKEVMTVEEAIKYLQMSIEMMPIDDADKLMQKEAKELLK